MLRATLHTRYVPQTCALGTHFIDPLSRTHACTSGTTRDASESHTTSRGLGLRCVFLQIFASPGKMRYMRKVSGCVRRGAPRGWKNGVAAVAK